MEQLDDIKENDEFWVRVRIERIDDLGVWFRHMLPSGRIDTVHDFVTTWRSVFARKVTSFDRGTGRKFKRGDKVVRVTRNGSTYDTQIGTVVKDEALSGLVALLADCNKNACFVPAHELALLIPAEERRPYYVVHNTSKNAFDICCVKDDGPVVRQSFFYAVGVHEGEERVCNVELTEGEANLAAAEECERLNDEYSNKLDTELDYERACTD